MTIDINKFRENATKDGLCNEYATLWDRCGSRKELIDLALGVKGIDYICDAIVKGWGVSIDYIKDKFGRYINGTYICTNNGKYTSEMYCDYKGEITCNTTMLALINCDVVVRLPKNHRCEIYATMCCDIKIEGNGQCVVVTYGDYDNITINASENVKYKRLHKKEKDRH